ncbi:MAG: glycosyltransferase involved in cell wall biosynthesis [Psychromonas sp.]|jgi:glycosyltransferase involved in cell wall biosynthesis|uniref:glycosyltransferase family 4 protein n=1 Tax=Psychromonas sp. TaxID=1884585 RepID=UPI0039E6F250
MLGKTDRKAHLLVIDPTAFSGGSKVATESVLRLLDPNKIRITVLSADPTSWHWPQLTRMRLYQPKWLARQEQGIAYFLRHLFIAANIMLLRIRFGRIDIGLGASGPGVDLSLYLLKPLLGIKLIQLIHGPVARSRSIARSLLAAEQVHYLHSSGDSLLNSLSCMNKDSLHTLPKHFHIMQNGLSEQCWPTACQTNKAVVFWAASLLKWKGLETLLAALRNIPASARPISHICYITPQDTLLPVSKLPEDLRFVHCHQDPHNLDQIRASANIFVSTSQNEPFGLSILEALAAGHCVLIPADGAYWDNILKDNINCIKYTANDSDDLMQKLLLLSKDMQKVRKIGQQASKVAGNYRAAQQYAHLKKCIENNSLHVRPWGGNR